MDEAKQEPRVAEQEQLCSDNLSKIPHEESPLKSEIPDSATIQPVATSQLGETPLEKRFGERMSAFEQSMVRLTRYGLAVTALTAFIFLGQLYEMYAGGTATDKLVGYANTQAKAANDISKASSDQAHAAQQFSDTAKDISNQISAAVNELNTQAQASRSFAELTRKQFALAQRPWIEADTGIGVHQGDVWVGNDASGRPVLKHPSELMKFPNQSILGNFPVEFTAQFKNVGLSPAINEWQTIQMKFVDLPGQINVGYSNIAMPHLPMCQHARRPKTNFVVFQNLPYTISTEQLPSDPDIEGWVHLKKALVVYGCIRYDDQMGGSHQTDFCSILDRTRYPVQWTSCPTGNDAW